jgi:hypothetical protein
MTAVLDSKPAEESAPLSAQPTTEETAVLPAAEPVHAAAEVASQPS